MSGYNSNRAPEHDIRVIDVRSVAALAVTLLSEVRHGVRRVVASGISS